MRVHGSATAVKITYSGRFPIAIDMLFGTLAGGKVWYRSNAIPLRSTAAWLTANCIIHGVPITEIYVDRQEAR